jgi:hypothetical protein
MATVGLHFILNVIEADRTLILLTVPSSRLDFMNYMHVTLGVNFIFINRQGNFWYLSWFHEVNSHFPSPQDGQFVLVSQTLVTKVPTHQTPRAKKNSVTFNQQTSSCSIQKERERSHRRV